MKKTAKFVMVITAGLLLHVGSVLYAQDPPQKKQPEGGAERARETTLTGCLAQSGSTFTLKTKDQKQITVTGPADMAKHSGHTVELTGKMTGGDTFQASQLKHVSASCQ
jgi:hypothetical protein